MSSTERIQVLLQPEEKLRLQRQAEREGLSLSSWMRRVALERLASATVQEQLATTAKLREFFERCRARERGTEPDWETQRTLIEQAKRSGSSGT